MERDIGVVERGNHANHAIRAARRTPLRHPAGKAALEGWRVPAAHLHEVSTSIGTGP
jgi:hypothetical protein